MRLSIWLLHYARKEDQIMVEESYKRIFGGGKLDPEYRVGAFVQYGEYRPIAALCSVLNPSTANAEIIEFAEDTATRICRGEVGSEILHPRWAGTWYHDLLMIYIEFLGEERVSNIFYKWAFLNDFLYKNRNAIFGIRTEKLIEKFLK